MRMGGSVETSIVVWSRYNTLKPFPKTLENEVIKGLCFTPFAKYYTKIFNFSVLKQVYSICTNFTMID